MEVGFTLGVHPVDGPPETGVGYAPDHHLLEGREGQLLRDIVPIGLMVQGEFGAQIVIYWLPTSLYPILKFHPQETCLSLGLVGL